VKNLEHLLNSGGLRSPLKFEEMLADNLAKLEALDISMVVPNPRHINLNTH